MDLNILNKDKIWNKIKTWIFLIFLTLILLIVLIIFTLFFSIKNFLK